MQAAAASSAGESPAMTDTSMEAVCAPDNVAAAVRAVTRNEGAPGVDGMTVRDLPGVLAARCAGRRSRGTRWRAATGRSRCVG